MKNFIKNTIQSQKIFYRYFRKKGFKRFLKENIFESEGSNEIKAKSIALGDWFNATLGISYGDYHFFSIRFKTQQNFVLHGNLR